MQILSLTLEDAKSYGQAQITFTEGVNAIVGHNGAGKSTILEAIGYAMFDMLGYSNAEFVREGAKSATVTVKFASSHDDRVYQVIRRAGRQSQHQIFDPELGAKVCEGKADVLTFLRQHMGVNIGADLEGLFRDAVGVPQGTFTAAFLQAASQRKNIFDPLLQVEEYRTAAERLNEPRKVLKERQSQLDLQISAIGARLERLPQLETQSAQRAKEIAGVRSLIEARTSEASAAEKVRAELEAIRQQVNRAQQRQAQVAQRVSGLQNQIESARKALHEALSARTIVEENQAGHERYLAAQSQQQHLDVQAKERQVLAQSRATVDKTLALAETEAQTLQHTLDEISLAEALVNELAVVVAEQTQLENTLSSLQQQRARLVDAQSAFKRQQNELTQLQARRLALQSSLERSETLRTQQSTLHAQVATLEQEIEVRRNRQADIQAEANAIKKHSETVSKIETALCPVCKQPLNEEHRNRLLAENDTQIATLRAAYATERNDASKAETNLSECKSQLQRTQDELLRLPRSDELLDTQKRIETLQTEVETLNQRVNELEGTPQQIQQTEARLKELGNPRQRSEIAANRASQRASVSNKLAKLQAELLTQQAQLAQIEAQLTVFADLDAKLNEVNAILKASAPAYQQVLSHRRMAERVDEQQTSVLNLEALLQDSLSEQQQAEAELSAVSSRFDPASYQQALSSEQSLRSEVASLHTRVDLLQQEQQRATSELEQLRTQQAELATIEAQRADLVSQEQVLESVRNVLKQAGPHITKAIIGQISNGAAQIFGDLMQDYSRQLQWNEDYSITLEVDGRARQFAQLSGGEQMSAALAVRLALLREMSNIDVAFFDEPTTNLDDSRRESLARQILDVRGFRQLFVISHDDTFEQATQNVIRVRRVDGQSRIDES